jgi:hypothetical protein
MQQHLPTNATASDIVRYHIHPDVVAKYPCLEAWAESHDAHDSLQDATDDLLSNVVCFGAHQALSEFLQSLPDSYDVQAARRCAESSASTYGELSDFFDACAERVDTSHALDVSDPDDTQRIFDAIALGVKVKRMRELRDLLNAADTEFTANTSDAHDARTELSQLMEELSL